MHGGHLAHAAHGVDRHDEIAQLVARHARDLGPEEDDCVGRLGAGERNLEGSDEPLPFAVLHPQRGEATNGGDRVGVGVERLLEEGEGPVPSIVARAEAVVVVGAEEELGGVVEVARARLGLGGQVGEGRRCGDRAVSVAEASGQARQTRRCRDREWVHAERFAVPDERFARHLRSRAVARLDGDPLEEHREAELEREAGPVVGGDRAQRLQRGDDGSPRARVPAPSRGHLAPHERLERPGVRRIEIEDARVRRLRVAHREAPLLERSELPESAEPRADVDERVAFAGQDP